MNQNIEKFKNSDSLTNWVKYFIYIQIFVAIIALASNFMEYQLLSDYQNGVYTSQEQAVADGEASDKRQQIISIFFLVTFVISGILILKWIYRANYNARQLGAQNMEFTPGWSIGWYFIPIFTLWKPYQAMKEIWKASHEPNDWGSAKTSSILGWWWFFWIVTNAIGNVSFRLAKSADELNELISLNLINQASEILSIPLAIVTLLLITRIYSAQLKHAQENS